MSKKFSLFFIAFILSVASTFGQTYKDLKLISTSPDELIRNDVVMDPVFDSDFSVCKLTLKHKANKEKVTFDDKNLVTGEEVEEIMDLLFPEHIRGKKTQPWVNYPNVIDITREYSYEKMKIWSLGGNERKKDNSVNAVERNDSIKSASLFVISFVDKSCN